MQSITTITTFVPVVDDTEIQRQLRKLGEREEDLAHHARAGYALAHTATVTGPDFTTFVDTLTRDNETSN
ncbi:MULTISPECIES: hypothetical protein [Micrococcales]|jgi:hypothetical protein|nr:hypothetical protein [Paenarthrobacter ureafaciens]TXH14744.1 MAG: hypothetical protein E6R02_00485 [Gammaproteobacteria bacterium]